MFLIMLPPFAVRAGVNLQLAYEERLTAGAAQLPERIVCKQQRCIPDSFSELRDRRARAQVCGRAAFTPPPYERQQPLSSTGSVIESPLTLVKTRMESSLGFQYTGIIQVQHLRFLLSFSRCWCDAAGVMLLV